MRLPLVIALCLAAPGAPATEYFSFKREVRALSAVQPRGARSDVDGDGVEDFFAVYEIDFLSLVSSRSGAILARYHGYGYLGWSVKSLPDLDGDGISEVLASAPARTIDGQDWRGIVFAFQGGSPSGEVESLPPLYSRTCSLPGCAVGIGLGVTGDLALLSTGAKALYVLDGRTGAVRAAIRNTAATRFGHPAAGIGDVDGDGAEDFAVGGSSCWILSGTVNTGEEWVDLGNLGPVLLGTLARPDVSFGTSEGDGDKDSFINLGDPAPHDDARESLLVATASGISGEGGIAAYRLKMGASGLSSTFVAISASPGGPIPHATSIASLGDLNDDDLHEFAVFDGTGNGRIVLVDGGGLLDGLDAGDILQEIRGTPERIFYGGMEGLGDQDGDGFQDLIVGVIDRGFAFFATYTVIPEGSSLPDCNENGFPDLTDLISNPIEMGSPSSHRVADGPQALVTADLNGDGAADFASANLFSKTVSVVLNDGAGDFADSTEFHPADGPRDILAADVDGDGALDLVTADLGTVIPSVGIEYGDTISILTNLGDGSFAPHRSLTFDGPPLLLATADWNGDLDQDLAIATTLSPSSVEILRNDGSGSFSVLPSIPVAFMRGLVAADLDEDRIVDLTVLGDSGAILRFKGRGDGTFDALERIDVGVSPAGIAVADLNGDGRMDLATIDDNVYYGPTIRLNIGDGNFGEPFPFSYGNATPMTVVAADIDLDSDLDLVTSNRDSLDGVWVAVNDGAGGFARVRRIQIDGALFDAVAADTDQDGDLDIGIVNLQYDEIGVFENLTVPPTSRDCNGNGRPDECDIALGSSGDCNRNGIPDSCDVLRTGLDRDRDGVPDECVRNEFHRGDSNGDGSLDIADPVNTLSYLFNGSAEPSCLETSDHNNDATLDISDPVALLMFLFASGAPPAAPGPPGLPCGIDPDASGSRADLGCASYSGCGPAG